MNADRALELRRSAQMARDDGRLAEALALQRQAVAAYAGLGDHSGHAHALRHLADMLSDSGDAAAATPLYVEVLGYHGDEQSLDAANAVRGAAVNAERLGAHGDARRLWSSARDRYAALDHVFGGPNAGVAEAETALARLG